MSFAGETAVKAVRKRKVCTGCGQFVEIGSPAIRWAGISDGEFATVIFHPDCREAEVALNKLAGTHWDEWMGLDDMEEEDWPWLIEDFPTVADRMGITKLLSDSRSQDDASGAKMHPREAINPLPQAGGEEP